MYFYFLVLVIILLLGMIEMMTDNKRISIGVGSFLALMAGFRYYTGYDFESYREYYYQAQTLNDFLTNEVLEPGFLSLSIFSSRLGFTNSTFVLIISLMSLGLLTVFLYKKFPYPTLALGYYYARFFHMRDMAQVRSSLASIILLFGIQYIVEKKFWKFLGIVAIASLFHSGSFVFILAYVLNLLFEKLNSKNITLMTISAIVVGILVQSPQWYQWAVPERYISYITAPSRMGGPWYTNPIVMMQLLIFFGAMIYVKFNDSDNSKYFDVLLKIYFIASLALIASNTLRVLGGRVSTFMATVEILIVPYLILSFSKNKLFNLLAYVGFTVVVFLLIFVISGRYLPFLPYRTLF